jgi:uncharacterized membrane protein (UPF0136 family)
MTPLQKIAAGAAGTYGLIAIVGGTIGYVKAGSLVSMVAGGVSGLVLIGSSYFVARHPKRALTVAIVMSILLVGRFAPKLGGPEGPSVLAIVMVLGGIAVIAASAFARKRTPANAAPGVAQPGE